MWGEGGETEVSFDSWEWGGEHLRSHDVGVEASVKNGEIRCL